VEADYLDYYQVLDLGRAAEAFPEAVDYLVEAAVHHLQVVVVVYQQLELALVLLEHPCNLYNLVSIMD
jgi:hypothetical protein